MKKNKKRNTGSWILMILIVLIVLAFLGFFFYRFYMDPVYRMNSFEGAEGWLHSMYGELTVTVLVFLVLMLIGFRILLHHKGEKKSIRFLGTLVFLIPSLVLGFFLLKEPLSDIPYLSNPKTVLLRQVKIEDQSLEGIDQDGIPKLYSLNKNHYESLKDQKKKTFAVVQVLPNTQVVCSVELEKTFNEKQIQSMLINSLKKDDTKWQLQVDEQVLTLGTSLSDAVASDWQIKLTEREEREYESLDPKDTASIQLVNQKGTSIEVQIQNKQDQAISLEEGTITSIYGSDLDSGMQIQLPEKIVVGWSNEEAVINAYGEPSASDDETITYQSDAGTMKLTFTKQGVLESVRLSA
ncbi:hypothetical protein [uncultured Faecalicoccus sp.]|uniref:hypothetical protein n=1 Tax=uncultured Faecalicoccus sp. TaxID=1971760 RepID=UPI0025F139A3|nr:hypothetical protein [uncultured Faecalicoccus sp.]